MALTASSSQSEEEKFLLVDAGDGEVALYNLFQKRYVRIKKDGKQVFSGDLENANELPGGEGRFMPIDVRKQAHEKPLIAWYNKASGRWIKLATKSWMKSKKTFDGSRGLLPAADHRDAFKDPNYDELTW